ncbi:receptor-like protein kinase 2 isoform X2 [Phoenix dactylifera]|uniref:non-specific serine/threonine protein kinase n=1 Tax=Phoenix dactylifera TaxID=42345 RepID=A0A8B8JA06_PHODC|nr:receptor-like protein kinase 2 isoform X2 [Phoenix dactylifera]
MMPRSRQHRATSSPCLLLQLFRFFFVFFFFFLRLPSFSSSATVLSRNPEVVALFSWIDSSVSPPKELSDWNPSDSSPCNWTHIACDSAGAVTSLTIQSLPLAVPLPSGLFAALHSLSVLVVSDANLTGSIPPDLSSCSLLTLLDLSSNSLSGSIPPSLSRLPDLHSLILNSNQLSGPVPAALGGATSLRHILLHDNRLSGSLPDTLGNLSRLESLRAGGNRDLSGPIPASLSRCANLSVLGLADTKISGPIPASLGQLSNLQTLSIYTAMLSGSIPPELGNCSSLINLFLYENALSGPLPPSLGRLPRLERLLLWQNSLSGPIPDSFGNLSSLLSIDLSINSISGAIPASLGKLSGLQDLMLSDNNVSGTIPPSLANLSSLSQLQLDTNQISGLIPQEFGALSSLTVLLAWQNQLEGAIPPSLASLSNLQALDLSHNHLTGPIPPGLFLLPNLTKLLLLSNDVSGSIPPEIGRCGSLVRLRLGSNRIGGQIPSEIGGLESINFLDLAGNRITGSVPIEIGNCSRLQMIDISNNTLSSALPESLSSIAALQVLDASLNRFSGPIPASFSKLGAMNKLVLGGNSLSGPIPKSLGQCSSLELLDLSSNQLSGSIPDELFQIESLNIALNLSRNALTGPIPDKISALYRLSVLDLSSNMLDGSLAPLAGLENLVSLNVSNNNFTGYLPDTKLFRQLSASELAGNQGLCTHGGDVCFVSVDGDGRQVMTAREESRRLRRLKLATALLITATVAMVLGTIGVIRARRMGGGKGGEDSDSEMGGELSWPWQFTPFQKLSFSVEQVVRSLVDANVIGKGCSGIVYRVSMDNGDVIAVKKLWPSTGAAAPVIKVDGNSNRVRDSFSAEVQTLGSVRHKNIVRFLGCCWNRSTRLLMYDYMANGSLGGLLHERSGFSLGWDLRYKIILGAAQGLAYLHHDCLPPIVHRDIKANNILIGLDFDPYIADFGLAKLVEDGDFGRSSNTVAGSYGYIAPEYGYMMKITEKSDVFSYGVVVLEVLTGKQPIDPTIPDGLHVVDWVRRRKGSMEVLHPSLRGRPDSEVEEMLQVLAVALLCVNPTPDDRPTMKDVAAMLGEIRHEREEYAKVDVLLKGSSPSLAMVNATTTTSTTLLCQQSSINSDNTSLSASSVYSSSKAK